MQTWRGLRLLQCLWTPLLLSLGQRGSQAQVLTLPRALTTGPACIMHGTTIRIVHGTIIWQVKVQDILLRMIASWRPFNHEVLRLHFFHQHPNASDFVQIKGQWMTGTHYFTTEPSSSPTLRWVRADSRNASGQPRGPHKGSNGEGVYSLELRTGNEIQLLNGV